LAPRLCICSRVASVNPDEGAAPTSPNTFVPKEELQGALVDGSAAGFAKAMDVSCHSFVRMARLAAPRMKGGGRRRLRGIESRLQDRPRIAGRLVALLLNRVRSARFSCAAARRIAPLIPLLRDFTSWTRNRHALDENQH